MSSEQQSRLANVVLLDGLSDDEKRNLEKRCRWRRYQTGEQILDKDSSDRDVYFVAEGALQVVNFSMTGREIALARLAAGSFFGELSAIDGQPRSASVVALENCLLGSLSPQLFIEQIVSHPELAVRVLQRLAGIVRSCDERIMDLSTLGAVERVYRQLLRLAEESPVDPGSWLIRALPTHKAIAAMASTTRETVARSVSQLAAGNIVERKGRILYLRDRERLEKLAGALDNALEESFSR
ncbi:MAG: Crp/Fnr family transcriptional regulator [Rhodospirillaceae bacterium]|nr:Crp/Fnr family transcriptional regulator [Rhodospirillaceae bacterium]MBT5193027.1 Crp/Fnr family transcriptional regulator [Rhodospirillaceae bacterium]MBT5895385.1 Crp/Fnr family transcriptional regulator [Rhodospirillaceae bacterium]MBT6429160.1 Crp/Fnr family transcriptional regulator [Rhodospirillaceae bacterium]MBT7756702.1 Crp/Fnr family transcriptional regulator [Rhodospirillaceae bacterium]